MPAKLNTLYSRGSFVDIVSDLMVPSEITNVIGVIGEIGMIQFCKGPISFFCDLLS